MRVSGWLFNILGILLIVQVFGMLEGCAPAKPKNPPLPVVQILKPLTGSTYLVDLEKKLRDQILSPGVSFIRDDQQLLLMIQCNLLFETDQYEFKYDAAKVIDPLSKLLVQAPPLFIDIKSYTDSTGPLSWNQRLSDYRAKSLQEFLQNAGVKPDLIRAAGFGSQNPIESNSSDLGRQANRRLEVLIKPPKDE